MLNLSKKLFTTLCLCALLSVTVGLQAQNTLTQAIKLAHCEQFDAAKNIFDNLLTAEPNNGDNYFYYGENYLATFFADTIAVTLKDVVAPARALFQKGTEVDPENPLCYVGLAKIALLTSDTAAVSYLKKAFSKFPSKTNKTSTLSPQKQALTNAKAAEAMIQAKVQNLTKAKELIEKAATLDPKNPEIFLIWGDVFLAENDGSNAILKYNMAQDLDPQSPSAKLRLGKLWGRARNWTNAIKFYEEAIAIDATFAPAYVELGAIYMMAKQNEKAKDYFQQYLKLSSTIRAKRKYASVLIDLKDYATAIPILLEIKQADPTQNDINRALSYCYFETKDYAKAKESIDLFFKTTKPEKVIVSDWVYRGKIENKIKNDSMAIEYYKIALSLDSSQFDLYSDIVQSFFNMKKYNDAVKWSLAKISANKANVADYYKLGQSYYFLSQWGKSDTAFAYINDKKPEYLQGKAYLWRARTANQIDISGDSALAVPYYEQYIKYARVDSVKNVRELIEAYDYLQYIYLKAKNWCKAKYYTEAILWTDPEGKIADVPKFKDLLVEYTKKCTQ